jgi:exonuclease III
MTDYLARPKHRKVDLRFVTWNIRSLYRPDSLKTVARELGKYKLDLVGVQEVRWDKGGTERAEDYTFFYGAGNEDHQLGTGNFIICTHPQTSLGISSEGE